ncbi:unnamed protein product [Symbiodinium natans]|uniref:Uncharacterized protein n=1 Tax=Symbiodinium natans TaxID=878477 RepID=A0A812T719_9DINO|nr:unnamed protein product [Symbiodinium natans]
MVPAFAGNLPLSEQKELPACWPFLMLAAGEVGGRWSSLLSYLAAPVFVFLALGMVGPFGSVEPDESEPGEAPVSWRCNARGDESYLAVPSSDTFLEDAEDAESALSGAVSTR